MSQDPAGWYHLSSPSMLGTLFLRLYFPSRAIYFAQTGFCPRSSGDMTPESLPNNFTTALSAVKVDRSQRKVYNPRVRHALFISTREGHMRRLVIVAGAVFVLSCLGAVVAFWTTLFPPALTENQRAILRRAKVGLELYATKSPTATSFAREVREQSQWTTSPIVLPEPPTATRQNFNVSVMSANPMRLVAFYLHPARSVCFIEESCDSLGPLALGLTYAHELQHRRDFRSGLIKNSDLPNSEAVAASEARAKLAEIVILVEYTEGRWRVAADNHVATYTREPARVRRHFKLGDRGFIQDGQWLEKEFGHLNRPERAMLLGHLLFTAKLSAAIKTRAGAMVDSVSLTQDVLAKP